MDISASEEAAQMRIYDLYMSSLSSKHKTTEYFGCGTAAEIAYMGHHTGCNEFEYIHERESYEVLLVMLKKKKKKVSFPGCPFNKNKRPKLHSPKLNKDDTEEINVNKVPKTNEETSKLSQKTIDLLAEAVESAFDAENSVPHPPDPPTNPPTNPPKSLFDQNAKSKDGVDCPNGEQMVKQMVTEMVNQIVN